MASKKEFGRLPYAEMKRIQALAVMLKSFFSFNLWKRTRRFIAKLLVYSQVLQLATVVVIPNPGNLNPYLSTTPNHNPIQVASLPYVGPLSPLLSWAQTGTLSNSSLTSEQLGLSNALAWGINYSNLTGVFFDAQYILSLSDQLALGLLGEYGPGQYRWNGTLGYGFSPLSQLKVSAERLGQRLPFQFDSGNIRQRVHQDAYGVRFQQLFEQPFLQGINLGGYYARAANQNLAPVIFTSNGLNCNASAGLSCINYRSIAGATSAGIDAGAELLLTPSTLLGANVYYDRVNYNTQLTDDTSNNRIGLGGAIRLKQLLGERFQLWGEASVRKIYDTYQGGVSWLPVSKSFGIELTVAAQHLVFHNNMQPNNSVNFEVRWVPDGSKSYDEHFHWQNKHLPEVSQWVRTPAVHMNQVLAIAEQITRLNSSPPSITNITPAQGPMAGGTSVTITGTNFIDPTISVTFGGIAASFIVDSDTQITVTTPAHAAGSVNVVVTTTGGSATSPIQFEYVAGPTVTGMSPNAGPTVGGTSVTITGTNFTGTTGVTFDGTAASFVVDSDTQITVTTPAHAAGAVNVIVTSPDGSAASPTQYTYVGAPSITSLSPVSGPIAGGTSVMVTGTNFTNITGVTFGGTAASFVVDNDTQITVTTPAHAAGAVNVVVTAPGGSATSPTQYTYVAAPTVTSISPVSGPTGGGTSVTITGTNFTAPATVNFGANAATNVTVVNATTITVNAPAGVAGAVNVVVTTPDGSATSPTQYTYVAAPTVTNISPVSGPLTAGTLVTISGTNFTAPATVSFGGNAATNVTVVNATTITVNAPAGVAGAVNVVVTTPGGSATSPTQYTYVAAPSITGISPVSGPLTVGTLVTISGTNFTAPATVNFGANAATNVTVVNATTITVNAPAGVAGAVNVVVTTPGGSATSPTQYTYLTQPAITGVSPNAGPTAGGTSVTISGTNFTGVTSVTFGGAAATGVTVVNPTTITVTTPTHAAGAVNVIVTAPSGTATMINGYTYVAPPSITGISPPSGSTAGGTFVTISGTNFNAPVTVTFAGNPATSVTVVNANTITVNTPPGLAGAVNVVVTTPGGVATSPTQYTYLV